jgi:hypothetical protein
MASYWESFTGVDWERAAGLGDKGACAGALVVGVVSIFLQYPWAIGVWTVFVGLLIATWELPVVYALFPRCEDIKTAALERVWLKHPLPKAALYVALSILCYKEQTLCILEGILLNCSSLLYIFAYVNMRSDAADGLTTDEDSSSEAGGKLLASQKFGTF